jgi:hypothetical protein
MIEIAANDFFSIEILLRHPSYDLESLAKTLAIEPTAPLVADTNKLLRYERRRTFFHARLHEGNRSSEYERALANVAKFIEKHATFWIDFMSGKGEAELILNHSLLEQAQQGDLCFKLHLEPRFLAELSKHGIALRVQAWKGQLSTRIR